MIVSSSVFVREVAFGQKRDSRKVWLVFVFWPSSFWGFLFPCCCCHLADGSLHVRVECLVGFVFAGFLLFVVGDADSRVVSDGVDIFRSCGAVGHLVNFLA